MGDYILKTGDLLKLTFVPPIVIPLFEAPIPLVGSSTSVKVNSVYACLQGDELPEMLMEPTAYTEPPFVTPGMGMVKIVLPPLYYAARSSNGKPLLLKGEEFEVFFSVTIPAIEPGVVPVPDPLVLKPGTGQFITTNETAQAA